ncbi:LytR C-terminal domain-containing protein [Yinghuangia seranimata]|uniref:LytR C-terminal domain-containing protein n=1 Tax=Yinghuangia seranimata TaxID=408067 RepID=UPI00248BBD1F|nr:LytR C-terminal domain-containing protein [Yinghuangia seranimata]MDI2131211.1 LytR C-terminal domain-containing protein [Yinghuangia seranimata]
MRLPRPPRLSGPRPARRRVLPDLTDPGRTFAGFGRTGGVWRRPDHLADAAFGTGAARRPLERLGPAGTATIAVSVAAALAAVLLAGFGGSWGDPDPRADDAPAAAASPAAVLPPPAAAAAGQAAVPPPDARTGSGEVVVLGQGRTQASMKAFAQRLTAAGWRVTGTGDWHGAVPATTVYHPAGQEAAAKRLAAAFPEVRRVKPTFAGISQTRLVVIVVDTQNPPLVRKVLGTERPKG